MEIALFTLSVLQNLFSRSRRQFVCPTRPTHPERPTSTRNGAAAMARAAESAQPHGNHRSPAPGSMGDSRNAAFPAPLTADKTAPRPARVLQHVSDSGTGRFLIAGRMADVCAQLERMAASEALRAVP